jgi:outer membrane protein assembly factor BamB
MNDVRNFLFILIAVCFGPLEVVAEEPSTVEIADLRTRKTGTDWPVFLGVAGDSKSSETGILKKWPEKGLTRRWIRKLGTSYGMPTIARGRLFQFDRHGNQARLTCMKSETGDALWKFEYPTQYRDLYGYNNGPRSSPTVDDDRVYILGAEGMLHCVRVVDGKKVWEVDTVKKFGVVQNFFGIGTHPIVEGDLLIVPVGGSPPGSPPVHTGPPGNGSGIVAFNKLTGDVIYKITDELASYSSPVARTIDGRRWCFVFARGGLVGFEPTKGKVDFQYPWRARIAESVNASNPVIVGDQVFISETYGPGSSLLKIKPGGYDLVWRDPEKSRQRAMQTHWNTSIHDEGYLYGSSGRHSTNAELRCIELATGKVRWSVPRLSRSSLLYADGHFVCLTEDGDLFLMRATHEKFDKVASFEEPMTDDAGKPLLEHPAWAAPVLSHGLLYVRGKNYLVCLELIPIKP